MSQRFYHKYQKALEAEGYRVDEYGYVWDSMGNQAAGEDNYGNVQSKDPNVTRICQEAENTPVKRVATAAKKAVKKVTTTTAKKKAAPKDVSDLEIVRARDKNGHFIADDPNTPDVNEAWVVKNKKGK